MPAATQLMSTGPAEQGEAHEEQAPIPWLMRGEEVYAVMGDIGAGRVILFADGHIFTNASMRTADNAEFVVRWVFVGVEDLEIVSRFRSHGARGALDVFHNSGLWLALLQGLLFALVESLLD